MRLFLEHIELWLSLAGLAIAALTAIGVGLLHGLIFRLISAMLDDISEESLRDWRDEYGMPTPSSSPGNDQPLLSG